MPILSEAAGHTGCAYVHEIKMKNIQIHDTSRERENKNNFSQICDSYIAKNFSKLIDDIDDKKFKIELEFLKFTDLLSLILCREREVAKNLIPSIKSLDGFHPERMASRILGMGDIISLVEKAEQSFDKDVAISSAKRLKEGLFTFEDYKSQIQQIKKMGSLSSLMSMVPGFSKIKKNINLNEDEFKWVEAIINSMTKKERVSPEIINGSRRKRIATGSGRTVQEVNTLIKQFNQMKIMIKKMKNKKNMNLPFNFG